MCECVYLCLITHHHVDVVCENTAPRDQEHQTAPQNIDVQIVECMSVICSELQLQ